MLDERKAAILRAVVQEYIGTGQPVGSSHIASAPSVGVSSATVRNEMVALEHEGYLTQPHTSAGRIPTDKGYRYFVDHLGSPGALPPAQRLLVRDFFAQAHGELEQMLHDTSRLLSNLTHYAGVVVRPQHEVATIRSVQLVGLTPRLILLVVVLSTGAVEKRSLELNDDTGDERAAAATAHLAAHVVGRAIGDPGTVPATGDARTDRLVKSAVASLAPDPDAGSDVWVGGAARMASAFDAVDTVRRVLSTLEEQVLLVSLLEELLERGLTVAIGPEEHGLQLLAECSIVIAPYPADGEHLGSVAVLGPTRMNYTQALAAVTVVSKRLGRVLGEG